MRIIVEGPDGAGKTTLVKRLEDRLGLAREPRRVAEDGTPLQDMRKTVDDDLVQKIGMTRLYDRHGLISGPIYSPIIHGIMEEPWNDTEWSLNAMEVFNEQANFLIICLPPLEEVRKNIERDKDSQLPALAAPGAIEAMYYGYLFAGMNRQAMTSEVRFYDYTNTHQGPPFLNTVPDLYKWLEVWL